MATDLRDPDLNQDELDLVQWIVPRVEQWEDHRDQDNSNRERWMEYYRMWRGVWSAQDRNRDSERSKAIMPALQQAVDSAVSEQIEGTFGRERWFDAVDPADLAAADRLLEDLWHVRQAVAETYTLGALYGTGIAKIVVERSPIGTTRPFRIDVVPVDPLEFVIDPGATTIEDALGVAHVVYVPRNVVERRIEDGTYEQMDTDLLDNAPTDSHRMHLKTLEATPDTSELVRLIEWHGRVPASAIGAPPGPDGLVEAIVTIGNDHLVLRANRNPFGEADRGFVSYQQSTVPRRFWGRGICEEGYWPQKVLDSEIRARTDALAFSVHPMMAINAATVPRGERFAVKPGRNIFINGSIRDNISPIQFPPPDPQTYQQSAEMERMVEMATGQLQAASSPSAVNARNDTATGMSMILGASIRRTRHTLANIERSFLAPLVNKVYRRYKELDRSYPDTVGEGFRVNGSLGIMARELEQQQMIQLMNALPPSPAQLGILKLMVENSGIADKSQVIDLINFSLQQQIEAAAQPQRDLSAEARMLSAMTRAEESRLQAEERARAIAIKERETEQRAEEMRRQHEARIMELSIKADQKEVEMEKTVSESMLNVAKAEAESLNTTVGQLKLVVDNLVQLPAPQAPGLSEQDLQRIVDALPTGSPVPGSIERDENGLITRVDGMLPRRDANNLIVGFDTDA